MLGSINNSLAHLSPRDLFIQRAWYPHTFPIQRDPDEIFQKDLELMANGQALSAMKLFDLLVVVLLLKLVLVSSIRIIGDDGVGQARQTLLHSATTPSQESWRRPMH